MSGVDMSSKLATKYGSNIGEVLEESDIAYQYDFSLARSIASDVVSDIIENALDIAISNADLKWEKSCLKLFKEEGMIPNMDSLDYTAPPDESPLSPNIKQIIDGLSSLSVNSPNINSQQPVSLDVEMKRLLTEMMSPPYPIINYEVAPRKDGVGDQPLQLTLEEEKLYFDSRSENILVEPETTRMVEKKSRVTDLVMNSKQVLSEFLMDESSRKKIAKWEEENEEVLNVIELDCVQPGEIPFKVHSSDSKLAVCKKSDQMKILPEDIPLPDDDEIFNEYKKCNTVQGGVSILKQQGMSVPSQERVPVLKQGRMPILKQDGTIHLKEERTSNRGETSKQNECNPFQSEEEEEHMLPHPNEDIMDIVDLSRNAFQEEERQLSSGQDHGNHCGKGDEYNSITVVGGPSRSQLNESAILAEEPIKPILEVAKKEGKKKKWSFGSRIFGFMKRRPKNKDECTTSSKKSPN